MSSPTGPSGVARYLGAGQGICLALQAVFGAQIGTFEHPVLSAPFLLAYSQKAMIDLLVYEAPWPIRAAIWLLAYAAIGAILWRIAAAAVPARAGRWATVFLAWASAELVLALLGFALLSRGIIQME